MKIDVSFVAFHSQKQYIHSSKGPFRVKAYCESLCQVLYTLKTQRGS